MYTLNCISKILLVTNYNLLANSKDWNLKISGREGVSIFFLLFKGIRHHSFFLQKTFISCELNEVNKFQFSVYYIQDNMQDAVCSVLYPLRTV